MIGLKVADELAIGFDKSDHMKLTDTFIGHFRWQLSSKNCMYHERSKSIMTEVQKWTVLFFAQNRPLTKIKTKNHMKALDSVDCPDLTYVLGDLISVCCKRK